MQLKMFEVRDRATYIPVIAMKLTSTDVEELYHLQRLGFNVDDPHIFVSRLPDGPGHYDPYQWENRTMHNAHLAIIELFDKSCTGAVIDIEYYLGETTIKKVSERNSW